MDGRHLYRGWAAAELPPGLPVQGNLDPLALLAGGDALSSAVKRVLAAFAGRPHIFNLEHGILQDTPIAHVEELIALVKGAGGAGGRGAAGRRGRGGGRPAAPAGAS